MGYKGCPDEGCLIGGKRLEDTRAASLGVASGVELVEPVHIAALRGVLVGSLAYPLYGLSRLERSTGRIIYGLRLAALRACYAGQGGHRLCGLTRLGWLS